MKEWKNRIRFYKVQGGTIIAETPEEAAFMRSDEFGFRVAFSVRHGDMATQQFGPSAENNRTTAHQADVPAIERIMQRAGFTKSS